MIIRLSEVENELKLRGEIEASRFPRNPSSDFAFAGPVSYELLVKKVKEGVRVTGSLDSRLSLVCSRCLDVFPFTVSAQLDVELEPRSLMPDASELELSKDEMDVDYLEGDDIDLVSLLYEEVLLAIPLMPLCNESCLGLCGVCGKNRNVEPCLCEEAPRTILAEKLKSFLS